ncbi:uncharacterized protein [Branchiostoma lanceolatum]|uniref:uncharacterized protein n=1 Tax=Branchiostoma lanceolatum TaxID=7740 RepID=UPI003455AAC4
MSKMFRLLVLTLLVCSVSGVPTISRLISLPSYNVNLLRDAGLPSLQDKVVTARNILIQTAEQVNVTQSGCASTIESYLQADCRTCVETKCQEKADSCSPDLWGVIAVQMESFFSFHADMMITAFSAAAGMHNFFVNVAQGAFDVWGNIFGGFVNGIGSAIEGVGNLFSSLFNRRVRNAILQYHVRRQVRSEPTCDQLQNDGGNACLQYTPSCGNVCDSEWLEQQYCPTFNLAMADYQAAVQEYYWVTTIPTNHNYAINQVKSSFVVGKTMHHLSELTPPSHRGCDC